MMFPKPKREENKLLLERIRQSHCCICGEFPSDPSHIRTRGSGGPDAEWNVVPKCRKHHREWGSLGWSRFCRRYPHFAEILGDLGWRPENGKLWHHLLGAEFDQDQQRDLQDRDRD